MKKLLRHITVYLLTTTVFVATTGLSVHQLYCFCRGEMVASILPPDEPCEVAQRQSPEKNCCKTTTCAKSEKGNKHDCSDCTSVYVKLDSKFLPSPVELNSFDIAAPQLVQLPVLQVITFGKNLLPHQQDLPPPPSGKTLLPWIQSFLC